jgi:signal transduction histidine kinase
VTDIRRIAEALQDADALETMDPVVLVESRLDRERESYPQATFETRESPEDAEVVADHLLEDTLGEVLENAVTHAETDHPTVTVTIETGEEWTTVTVADDGPGVPEALGGSVFEMAEYGPSGGAGMGLFLVRSWNATAARWALPTTNRRGRASRHGSRRRRRCPNPSIARISHGVRGRRGRS